MPYVSWIVFQEAAGGNAPNASPPFQQMPAPPARWTTIWPVTGRTNCAVVASCPVPAARCARSYGARCNPCSATEGPGGHEPAPGAGGERGSAPGASVMAIRVASTTHETETAAADGGMFRALLILVC